MNSDAIEFKIPMGMIVIATVMFLGYGMYAAGPTGAAAVFIAMLIHLAISLVGGVIMFILIGMVASVNFGSFPRALLKLTAIIMLATAIYMPASAVLSQLACIGALLALGLLVSLYWLFSNWSTQLL